MGVEWSQTAAALCADAVGIVAVKTYSRPYFVTPHAVNRFKERVANIPPAKIIHTINTQMQNDALPIEAEWRHKISLIYRCHYYDKMYYPVVVSEDEKEWPAIITVMGEESAIHRKGISGWTKKTNWTMEDDSILIGLLQEGFSQKECAQIMRWSSSTIHNHMPSEHKPRGSVRRWTEDEKELLIKYKFAGWKYKKIAKKLGRSESAIKIQMCRHKKKIREDPDLMNVVRVLSFCLNPGRLLSAARKSDLLSEIREREEERKINDDLIRKAARDW